MKMGLPKTDSASMRPGLRQPAYNPPPMPAVGLFGAPGSGKSTVFKALTRQSAAQQFATLDLKPHQAMVKIPDPRLDKLVELVQPRSIVHAAFEFVDIPGFDAT